MPERVGVDLQEPVPRSLTTLRTRIDAMLLQAGHLTCEFLAGYGIQQNSEQKTLALLRGVVLLTARDQPRTSVRATGASSPDRQVPI